MGQERCEEMESGWALYRAMFEGSPFSVTLNKPTGEFVDVNENFVRVTGVTRDEAIGCTPAELGIIEHGALATILEEIARTGGRLDGHEIAVRSRREATLHALLSTAVVKMNGEHHVLCIINNITERRLAELSLRQSEEKYRELVQNANSIILRWGRDGTIYFFNEFAQEFFGFTTEEIVGRNVMGTIVPQTETSGRDLQAMIEQITAHPEYHGTNVNENMRKNGERVWIAWTNKPVLDEDGDLKELLSVGLDITNRIQAQQALQESEARYRSIFNSNVDAFLVFDTHGKIVDANSRACELFGYSRGELAGLECADISGPGYCSAMLEAFSGAAVGSWFQRESVAVRKDGGRFDVEVHGARLQYGSQERLLAILFDVTERNRSRELQRRAERLEARQARLKAEAAQRSSFFASMSHELRTPLTCILGFTDLLMADTESPITPGQRDMLASVSHNAHRLVGLLNDMLSLSRLEARRVAPVISEVDLCSVMREVVANSSSLAKAKGLDVVVDCLEAPMTVWTDEQKVTQILLNLVTNAVKFTETGSVTLKAEATAEVITLRVADTGVGIPKSQQSKIFKEFFTSSDGISGRAPGAGLGLAITKRLCQLLGAKIRVSSELGQGSTFTVTLPNRK